MPKRTWPGFLDAGEIARHNCFEHLSVDDPLHPVFRAYCSIWDNVIDPFFELHCWLTTGETSDPYCTGEKVINDDNY